MGFLSFIPASAWRWIAIVAVSASFGFVCWLYGRAGEERVLDEYKAQIKLAADKQAYLTAETIKAHKQLQEIADAEAQAARAERDAATLRVRQLVQAGRDSRLVPAPSGSAAGSERVCSTLSELDRGVRQNLGRVSERIITLAGQGQQGIDTAIVGRDWAKGVANAR